MTLANENKLSELSIRFGELSVAFKKNQQPVSPVVGSQYANQLYNLEQAICTKDIERKSSPDDGEFKPVKPVQKTMPANLSKVVSPLAGVFYRAPSPTASPFVEIGQIVGEGQVLCIIEAMKIMNEITSETSGTIVQILVQNGTVVEEGETLFLIDKGGIV